MSSDDRERWNRRYSAATDAPPSAAWVLRDNRHLLPAGGRALDLACGRGGNALLLAEQGLTTDAWDIADRALIPLQQQADRLGLPLTTRAIDLDQQPLPSARFEVICVSGFLNRPLCPAIIAALKPAGLLFYQTFTRDQRGSGPANPRFLLAPGELLALFAPLEPLLYRDERDAGDLQQGLRGQAALIARKRGG